MNGFARLVTEDIRLSVLRVLAQDAGYSHNEYVLKAALAMVGHKVGSDRLRTELAWLAEQGLVETNDAAAGVLVASLTARGADVGMGRAVTPGVKRPEPWTD